MSTQHSSSGPGHRSLTAKTGDHDPHAAPIERVANNLGNFPWTAEEIEILRRQWTAGVNVKAIAREVGRTVMAIKRRRLRDGLPNRRYRRVKNPDSQRDTLVTVALDEESFEYVAKRAFSLNMSRASYMRMLLARDRGFTR